jgi:hypothetical protein
MSNRKYRLRMMGLRRREVKIGDIVKTKCQLFIIKREMYNIFSEMKISKSKLESIKIRFGQDREFSEGCQAFIIHNKKEVVLKRGERVVDYIANIAHEIGHEVTRFGKFSIFDRRRCNIIGEISAYNFEELFLKRLNKIKDFRIVTNYSFWGTAKISPKHGISQIFKNVSLGSMISSEYKYKKL